METTRNYSTFARRQMCRRRSGDLCTTKVTSGDIILVSMVLKKESDQKEIIGKYYPTDNSRGITCFPTHGTKRPGRHGDRYADRVILVLETCLIVEYLKFIDRWLCE